ncbi:MAG: GlsB/YeaQ/YmgE family stress response membrane protein [Actinomycetota bacterium]
MEITVVSIIGFLVVGLVVGALARLLMPGRDPVGFLGTLAVGAIGAFLGGLLSAALPFDNEGVPWIASIVCAMALLFVVRKMTYRRSLR